MSSFKNLRIVDNFYQTSSFFPMPTVLISTLTDDGQTTCGPYSLIQPYYVAGKDYYAMLLQTRNSSNTSQNLLKRGKCAINFVTDKRSVFKEVVRLGWPGDTSKEKMAKCTFTFEDGHMAQENPQEKRPQIIQEAYQVFECTWMSELDGAQDDKPGFMEGYPAPYHDFNGITSEFGAHFILRIDKILMKDKQHRAIINGVKAGDFPAVPVDYGYRDSKNFWYTKFRRPIPELLPVRATTVDSVLYAGNRIDPEIKFSKEACELMVNVPRIFLPLALKACVAHAKEQGATLVTPEHVKAVNDKRNKEKK